MNRNRFVGTYLVPENNHKKPFFNLLEPLLISRKRWRRDTQALRQLSTRSDTSWRYKPILGEIFFLKLFDGHLVGTTYRYYVGTFVLYR